MYLESLSIYIYMYVSKFLDESQVQDYSGQIGMIRKLKISNYFTCIKIIFSAFSQKLVFDQVI